MDWQAVQTSTECGGPGGDRTVLGAEPPLRAEVAQRVCAALGWLDTLGHPKQVSCRVGRLRRQHAGLIDLPAVRNGNGRGLAQPPAACPAQPPLAGSVGQLSGLRLVPVADKAAAQLWNERIDHLATLIPPPRLHRHHYRGVLAPNAPLRAAATAYRRDADLGGAPPAAKATASPAAAATKARSPAR